MTANLFDHDKELEARLLVGFCGWRWLRRLAKPQLCGLFPPHDAKDGDWQMAPLPDVEADYFESVEGVPPVNDRFRTWDCCVRTTGPHNQKWQVGMPAISIDVGAVAMLKEAILHRKDDYWISVVWETSPHEFCDRVEVKVGVGDELIHTETICDPESFPTAEARAVCLAAAKLLGRMEAKPK